MLAACFIRLARVRSSPQAVRHVLHRGRNGVGHRRCPIVGVGIGLDFVIPRPARS